MTWPHFDQGKGLRLVRPRRMVVLEWLRTLRHNLVCDVIHWHEQSTKAFMNWKLRHTESVANLKHTETPEWGVPLADQFRENRDSSLAEPKSRWSWLTTFRTQGVRPTWWPLLLLLGITIGFAVKWQAEASLTIGYNDYLLPNHSALYDIGELEKNLLMKEAPDPAATAPSYPACSLLVP